MQDSLDKFKKAVEEFSEHLYQITQIVLMNPEDIMRLNLNDVPNTVFFISEPHAVLGEAYVVKDSSLKRMLYDFIEKHPDRVFRGKKV